MKNPAIISIMTVGILDMPIKDMEMGINQATIATIRIGRKSIWAVILAIIGHLIGHFNTINRCKYNEKPEFNPE